MRKRKKSNNSQPNTLGVFHAMFFNREKLLRLKTEHEVLTSYIPILKKHNHGVYNLIRVIIIKNNLVS